MKYINHQQIFNLNETWMHFTIKEKWNQYTESLMLEATSRSIHFVYSLIVIDNEVSPFLLLKTFEIARSIKQVLTINVK